MDFKIRDSNKEKMVSWFSPKLLILAVYRKIISEFFGSYADARLVHSQGHRETEEFIDLNNSSLSEQEIWFDYVADVGDGFDSTYSIAYLLGKDQLKENGEILPQGNFLIMGGDQVYPVPSRENYKNKIIDVYSAAFPKRNDNNPPLLFVLPGNHDWYDGLNLFYANFCNGLDENRYLGKSNWRLKQKNSYFAIKLPDNWWIWGVDTQLSTDIDQAQAEYFHNIATSSSEMKLIICVPEPSWLNKINTSSYDRTLKFITGILNKEKQKIYCVLSGDIHHYNRYETTNLLQFITAGGGGAFLHPTHNLESSICLNWCQENIDLSLKEMYPKPEVSQKLAWGNLKFIKNNWSFSLLLCLIYTIISMILISTSKINLSNSFFSNMVNMLTNPITLVFAGLFMYSFNAYDNNAENKNGYKIYGYTHAIIQFSILLLICSLSGFIFHIVLSCVLGIPASLIKIQAIAFPSWNYFSTFIFLMTGLIEGLISSFLFGLYLLLLTKRYKRKDNDAFAAMGLDCFKNFLRIKISKDGLTIYAIGIDEPPRGKAWKENINSHGQVIYAPDNINYHVIEKIHIPIGIDT